jgi:tetratricopeptide (TPR) repeat protein
MSSRDDQESSLRNRLKRFEKAREQGQTSHALEGFRAVRQEAAKKGDTEIVALATAHMVVCYKHIYQNTKGQSSLLLMEAEIKQALSLLCSKDIKTVLLLRYADLECERGNLIEAESFCRQADQLIIKGGQSEAECLRRWAQCKTLLGKLAEAEQLLNRSAEIVKKLGAPKTFESVSFECGLLAHHARLSFAQRRYAAAAKHFCQGYVLAWEYRLRYGMPQRVTQYHRGLFQALGAMHRHVRR